MPCLTAEEVNDLGNFSLITFATERMRDAAFARYKLVVQRDRDEAARRWLIQP